MFDHSLLRDACRALLRHRRAALVTVATLAILGAVTIAMLSLSHNLLRSPWTYDTDRLAVLRHGVAGNPLNTYVFAADEYRALQQSGLFEVISASRSSSVAFGDGQGAARSVLLSRAMPATLEVTDAQPLLGRFVEAGETADARNVVLSHSLWQSDFDGANDVLGRRMLLGGTPYTIIGVMPPRFHFQGGDLWTAHDVDPQLDTSTEPRYVLNAKFRRGADLAALQDSIAQVAAAFPRRSDTARYPEGWRMEAVRVIDAVVGPQRQAMALLVAGAFALLLLGVANVAAMMVARQMADAHLFATRLALGEPRARRFAVALLESLILASVALALALALGRPLFGVLAGMISVDWVPRELEGAFTYLNPSLWTLPLIALGIALALTAIRLPGLLRIDPRTTVEATPRSGGRRGETRAATLLAGLQVGIATAVVLLTLAIAGGLDRVDERDLGFEPDAARHARLILPADRYPDLAARIALFDRLDERLRRDAGAGAVGLIDTAPLQRYARAGSLRQPGTDRVLPVDYRAVHGDVVGALGLRLLEGRFVDARDTLDAEPAMVISRALARQFLPEGSALGATLTLNAASGNAVARRVVGVVEDVNQESPLAAVRPTAYVPFAQEALVAPPTPGGAYSLLLRQREAGTRGAEALAAAIGAVDPWIALREVESFDTRAQRSLSALTMSRQLFALFSALGIVVAVLGIAAASTLGVARRSREIAIRMAIGAAPTGMIAHVVGGSFRTAAIAAVAGVGVALALLRVVDASLQDVTALAASDALLAPALLAALAVLAALWPAWQASRVNPVALLRR